MSVSEADALSGRPSPRVGAPSAPPHGSQQAWAGGPLRPAGTPNSARAAAIASQDLWSRNQRAGRVAQKAVQQGLPMRQPRRRGTNRGPSSVVRPQLSVASGAENERVRREREVIRQEKQAEYLGAKRAREAYRARGA